MENNSDPLNDIEQQQQAKTTETKRTVGTSTRMLEGNFRPAGKKRPVGKKNYYYQLGRTLAKKYANSGYELELDPELPHEDASDLLEGFTDTIDAMEKEAIKAEEKKMKKERNDKILRVASKVGIVVGGAFVLFLFFDVRTAIKRKCLGGRA